MKTSKNLSKKLNKRKLNIDIQKLFYRATPLLCCVVLLLSYFAVPASAADVVYYEDLVVSTEFDGEETYVTLGLPVDEMSYQLFNATTGETIVFAYGDYVEFDVDEDYYHLIFSYKWLSLKDIPDGAVFTFSVDIKSYDYGDWLFNPRLALTDGASTEPIMWLVGDKVAVNPSGPTVSTVTLEKNGASACIPQVYIRDICSASGTSETVKIGLLFAEVTFSMSALAYMQQQTGETNELLQLILDKLDQMQQENLTWYEKIWQAITDGFNAVLDAIGNIIGISDADKQAAEDFKNEAIDKSEVLEDAVDSMGAVNKPPADQVQAGMDNILPSDGGNYVSQTMNVIVGYPLVAEQLSIVVIIMFASFVLFGKKEA